MASFLIIEVASCISLPTFTGSIASCHEKLYLHNLLSFVGWPFQRPRRITPPSPVEDGCGVELGDLLSMAVELNRNAAQQRNVRIHCYVLDQSLELERKDVLLAKLDILLGRAVQNAHWGSLITCQAGIENDEAKFYIRFAVPTCAEGPSTSGIDWVDELWSWSLSETVAHMH